MVDSFPFVFHTTASWSNGHWDVVLMKMSQQLFNPWIKKRERERKRYSHRTGIERFRQWQHFLFNSMLFQDVILVLERFIFFNIWELSWLFGMFCFAFSMVWISEFSWSSTCCYPRLEGPVLITNRFYRVESLTLCPNSFEFKVDLIRQATTQSRRAQFALLFNP